MAINFPLIVINGLVQRSKDNTVRISKINFGPQVNIDVSSNTITITNSFHFVTNTGPSGTQNIDTILGGEEGDFVIFEGDKVRFRNNQDNIRLKSNYVLKNEKTLTLVYNGTTWIEVARA